MVDATRPAAEIIGHAARTPPGVAPMISDSIQATGRWQRPWKLPSLPVRGQPIGWLIMLAAIPLLAGFYLLLPTEGQARTIAYPAYGLIGTMAILIGIHVRRPVRPGAWRLIAAAFALLSVGDVTYLIISLTRDVGYPTFADIPYLAGYVCLILGFGVSSAAGYPVAIELRPSMP